MKISVKNINRAATRKPGDRLNILCSDTHERYQTNLCQTNANFYSFGTTDGSIKNWNPVFAPVPSNYFILPRVSSVKDLFEGRAADPIPPNVQFDLVLSQEKYGQFPALANLAQVLNLPLISLEHTQFLPEWTDQHKTHFKNMRGHKNVFISDWSRKGWGWDESEADVIHHGIDTDFFCPDPDDEVDKKNCLLSVVNDFIKRDSVCGYSIWRRVTANLDPVIVGDTPGLSLPANGTLDLLRRYRSASIFLNTSTVSPVPTSMLESMAVGLPVVSTATCMIPEIIQNGVNGFISNNENELRKYCQLLLKDEALRKELGANARKTILEKFSLKTFVDNWNRTFTEVLFA